MANVERAEKLDQDFTLSETQQLGLKFKVGKAAP
jgi:hypothetical protein